MVALEPFRKLQGEAFSLSTRRTRDPSRLRRFSGLLVVHLSALSNVSKEYTQIAP